MPEKNDKKKIISKLRHKYRLIIYNDITLQEVWHLRLSRLNVFTTVGISGILLTTVVIILIAFTPLKEFIPGFPDGNMQKTILNNAQRVDSLEQIVKSRNIYLRNLKTIISGDSIQDDYANMSLNKDTNHQYDEIEFTKSREDTLLRQQVAEADLYNLSVNEGKITDRSFKNMHFFAPLKGPVTNSFNSRENHFGTDIVAAPNEAVLATLDGTIVLATWTLATGYVIQIQHDNNLVSFYKHNSVLLKKVGDIVKAGETIAIIGNSGELTTGPHLHFELWHNGVPLNPEDYIIF
jgi:murein DD-endopeptidase MepM/ murein hydrolase activator NlpD